MIDWSSDWWIYGKLAACRGLTGSHMALAVYARAFAADRNDKSEKYFRLINEVPTVLMIGIVILVIVKPF